MGRTCRARALFVFCVAPGLLLPPAVRESHQSRAARSRGEEPRSCPPAPPPRVRTRPSTATRCRSAATAACPSGSSSTATRAMPCTASAWRRWRCRTRDGASRGSAAARACGGRAGSENTFRRRGARDCASPDSDETRPSHTSDRTGVAMAHATQYQTYYIVCHTSGGTTCLPLLV